MHHISPPLCDEFIQILGQCVEEVIVCEIKSAKYCSVSVNCTSDVSHTDQLTLIFRYALATGPVKRFIKFIPIYSHTGTQLACVLLKFLEERGINTKDCRGQSYDNASNMSGKYIGMQNLMCKKNPLVKFISC